MWSRHLAPRLLAPIAATLVSCSGGPGSQTEVVDAGTDPHAVESGVGTDAKPDGLEPDSAPDTLPPACTPASSSPAQGPGGYPLDGWSWSRRGVVLEDPTAGKQGGYIAPAAVVVGDTIHLWVTRKQGTVHRIHHSVSTDGATFAPPVETTGLQGEDIIAYPSVLHDGQQYLMWYGAGSIDFASSDDGVSWTMKAAGVLKPGADGQFDSMSLLYPSVARVDSGYVMYYTGFNGGAFGIGRAQSADGASWTRAPADAVLPRGQATEFDNHAAAQPCAIALGAGFLLWYGGYDTSKANPGPYRIGLAQSLDGASFERRGVTLDLTESGQEAWSTRDPAVIRWKGGWWMAYAAMGDDAKYRIAVATSETCAPW